MDRKTFDSLKKGDIVRIISTYPGMDYDWAIPGTILEVTKTSNTKWVEAMIINENKTAHLYANEIELTDDPKDLMTVQQKAKLLEV